LKTRTLTLTALFVALGVILPAAFHLARIGGPIFLPMHLPVLIAGLYLGPLSGTVVGLLSPPLSFLTTGMPPLSPPIMPMMMPELGTYGLVAGLAYRRFRWPLYLSLVVALLAGRLALGAAAAVAVAAVGFRMPPHLYVWGALVKGLPGIGIQLVLVPLLVRLLERSVPAGKVGER